MSFWGRVFGSPKAIESAVDGISKGIDALIYTEEEKETDAKTERAMARGMVIEWMKNSQGQNLSRRFLAILIAFTWLGHYLLAEALAITAIWAERPEQLMSSAAIVSTNADSMTGAMMLILGFYFAAPHLGKIVDGAMTRFGKQ